MWTKYCFLSLNESSHTPHVSHLGPTYPMWWAIAQSFDLTEIVNQNPYPLSDEQQKHIIKEIYNNDYSKFHEYKLALSEFSIDIEAKGKFVVAYRELTYDPVKKNTTTQ